MNIVVTGGLGFIGSHFVDLLVKRGLRPIVVDALTYAGHRENLQHLNDDAYRLEVVDIADAPAIRRVLHEGEVDAVFNFAAETHVDRSIEGPAAFVQTNVVGTSVLLAESLRYWTERGRPTGFRYVQVSTDEVYGALEDETSKFSETMPYEPNSPYSATKAGGDHLVRSYHRTYGLPALVTHCSNNYGPRQFPEKLIPAVMRRALEGKPLGVYGRGEHVRDWLHVEDHCRGIWLAFEKGRLGEHYCFGGGLELKNLELVENLCDVLMNCAPRRERTGI